MTKTISVPENLNQIKIRWSSLSPKWYFRTVSGDEVFYVLAQLLHLHYSWNPMDRENSVPSDQSDQISCGLRNVKC